MRMTTRKKEILTYFEPDNLEWVTGEVGAPPFDVSGMAYLNHSISSFDNNHQLESTRRTLETMVRDGLLEKTTSYEQRQNKTQSGDGGGVWCNVARYGLPGSGLIMRDTGGKLEAIDGESIRISDY